MIASCGAWRLTCKDHSDQLCSHSSVASLCRGAVILCGTCQDEAASRAYRENSSHNWTVHWCSAHCWKQQLSLNCSLIHSNWTTENRNLNIAELGTDTQQFNYWKQQSPLNTQQCYYLNCSLLMRLPAEAVGGAEVEVWLSCGVCDGDDVE